MEFSRQEYWSGLPFPSPEDLPDPAFKPGSPALKADSLSQLQEVAVGFPVLQIRKPRHKLFTRSLPMSQDKATDQGFNLRSFWPQAWVFSVAPHCPLCLHCSPPPSSEANSQTEWRRSENPAAGRDSRGSALVRSFPFCSC